MWCLNDHLNTQNSIICLFFQKSFIKISTLKANSAHLFTSFSKSNPTVRYFKEIKSVQEAYLMDLND